MGEVVIFLEGAELVPVVGDTVDLGIVRTLQIALQLQVIGRIGEDEIDALRRQRRHLRDAIAHENAGAFTLTRESNGASDWTPRDATLP